MNGLVVLGADGWLGQMLTKSLGATGVPFGPAFEHWLENPSGEVVVNCTGWRVKPGLQAAAYQASHVGTSRRIAERLSPGQSLLHFSSASVLGARRRSGDGRGDEPGSFPCRPYAEAKWAAEDVVLEQAERRGFHAVILRPAILYAPHGEGMVGTLLKLAARGALLRILPGDALHHLCSDTLLTATLARLAAAPAPHHGRRLVIADPFTLTNAEILRDLRARFSGREWPLPVGPLSSVLRLFPRLRFFDLRTWGEILAIWALDAQYDAAWLWRELELDPAAFAKDKRWMETLQAGS